MNKKFKSTPKYRLRRTTGQATLANKYQRRIEILEKKVTRLEELLAVR